MLNMACVYPAFAPQTRSQGIKSCYEVRDISVRGVFCIQSNVDKNKVLSMKLAGACALKSLTLPGCLELLEC
jgi:hypothetical protein